MKLIKKITLFFVVVLAIACQDQASLLIGGVFKNLFNGNLFESSASDSAYDQMKTKTESDRANGLPDCIIRDSGPINSSDYKNFSKIKENICTCEAWGTCDNKSCSCEKLCPLNFEILNRGPQSTGSRVEDQFAFDNVSVGQNYTNYEGFCWGFASLSQKFQRLAKFNLVKKVPEEVSSNIYRRKDYFKSIIQKIRNNEPVEIPGYSSVRNFTSDPMIQELLTPEIADTWQENAVSWQGLQSVKEGHRMAKSEYNNIFDDIETQLANHQAPKILFNREGSSGWAHVVQVQKVINVGMGIRYLCVWDNAFPLEDSKDCKKKMVLDSEGKVKYGYNEIGKIQLPHDEKSETVAQITNLHKKCNSDYFCNQD